MQIVRACKNDYKADCDEYGVIGSRYMRSLQEKEYKRRKEIESSGAIIIATCKDCKKDIPVDSMDDYDVRCYYCEELYNLSSKIVVKPKNKHWISSLNPAPYRYLLTLIQWVFLVGSWTFGGVISTVFSGVAIVLGVIAIISHSLYYGGKYALPFSRST